MLRSLWSGVSGLRTHQTRMDVIGNDIANVNTTGYKQSDVTFKEQLVNTIRPPSESTSGLQVGMGVQLGSIARNFSDGILMETQRASNMAVTGEGFFVVADPVAGGSKYFTRAGDFLPGVDTATGETYFVNSAGKRLQGIMDANPDSTGQTSAALVDIVLPANTTDYAIGSDGKIWASIAGATPVVIGMVPLALFANNNGLVQRRQQPVQRHGGCGRTTDDQPQQSWSGNDLPRLPGKRQCGPRPGIH